MIDGKIIKVCGMRESENISQVDALGIDLMGFIFYPGSPRYIASPAPIVETSARRVGVFVDASEDQIVQLAALHRLDFVQLHGAESATFCRNIAKRNIDVIKAFSVAADFDFSITEPYAEWCKLFVFDTKCSGYGGSGQQFDWHLLDHYTGHTPFLLSGGIDTHSALMLREFHHPTLAGYDLNSRFESAAAIKDTSLLTHFFEQLK